MEQLYEAVDAVDWNTALGLWQAARDAENQYDEAYWTPAYHVSEAGGAAISPDLNCEIERLQDVRLDAEEKLVFTPALNLPAVMAKMELCRKRWEDFSDWPDTWWDAVMCDLRRLAGKS